MNTNKTILSINNLLVKLYKDNTSLNAVNDVSISLNEGETVAIVGESGSGKSTLALSIMGLLPKISKNNIQGIINFEGTNLLNISSKKLAKIRGNEISIIFQDNNLLNDFTAIENVMMPLIIKGENISNAENQAQKKIYTSLCYLLDNFSKDNWMSLYLNWEVELIQYLGFGFNVNKADTEKDFNENTITINIDNVSYKMPKFLISKNSEKINNGDIYNGLNFSRSILENKFFNPNNLRFPYSRKLLEKKFI